MMMMMAVCNTCFDLINTPDVWSLKTSSEMDAASLTLTSSFGFGIRCLETAELLFSGSCGRVTAATQTQPNVPQLWCRNTRSTPMDPLRGRQRSDDTGLCFGKLRDTCCCSSVYKTPSSNPAGHRELVKEVFVFIVLLFVRCFLEDVENPFTANMLNSSSTE